MAENEPTLKSFDISPQTGFIPETPPPTLLPDIFKEWNEVASNLSDLLKKKQLRDAVSRLPHFNCQNLGSIDEWRTALVLLSGIFQGYMWQDGENGVPKEMPEILCVPFHKVSEMFGTPLVGTYASVVLYNWRLRDPEKGMTMENLEAIVNHTGTDDESWFFIIHVVIELAAVSAIVAIWDGLSAIKEGNSEKLVHCLKEIESALNKMKQVLTRMNEGCDPKTFYVNIRPFVAGTENDKVFPNGMKYKGVYEEIPQRFCGGSAAQSTPLKALDAFLGIEHEVPYDKQYLEGIKNYIPEKHRQFLEFISSNPPLRQYLVDSGDESIIKQYNATIGALVSFRDVHIRVVTTFIVNQTAHTVHKSLEERGTGGTPFMRFLKSVRDDTKDAVMQF